MAPALFDDASDGFAALTLVFGTLMAFNVKPHFGRFFVPAAFAALFSYAQALPLVSYFVPVLGTPLMRAGASIVIGLIVAWIFLKYIIVLLAGAAASSIVANLPMSKMRKYILAPIAATVAKLLTWMFPKAAGYLLDLIVNPLLSSLFVAGAVEHFYQAFQPAAPKCLTWKVWKLSCGLESNHIFWVSGMTTLSIAVVARIVQSQAFIELIGTVAAAQQGTTSMTPTKSTTDTTAAKRATSLTKRAASPAKPATSPAKTPSNRAVTSPARKLKR